MRKIKMPYLEKKKHGYGSEFIEHTNEKERKTKPRRKCLPPTNSRHNGKGSMKEIYTHQGILSQKKHPTTQGTGHEKTSSKDPNKM